MKNLTLSREEAFNLFYILRVASAAIKEAEEIALTDTVLVPYQSCKELLETVKAQLSSDYVIINRVNDDDIRAAFADAGLTPNRNDLSQFAAGNCRALGNFIEEDVVSRLQDMVQIFVQEKEAEHNA